MNDNWSGFVMDCSEDAMNNMFLYDWYWRYDLTQKAVFIDKDNINNLLNSSGFSDIGLLSIDIDGNDYHVFNKIDLSKLNPSIIIIEYNSIFGDDRCITIPYNKDFIRSKAHYSNLYYGASLAALDCAASSKGYSLVCSNNAGNNAYFVRSELLNERVKAVEVKTAYRESKFRESRGLDKALTYLSGKERLKLISGLDVLNVKTGELEKL